MDEQTREAAEGFKKLDQRGMMLIIEYINVLAAMDKLNDPELERMDEALQLRITQKATKEELEDRIGVMIARVNKLTENDKSPLYGVLSARG